MTARLRLVLSILIFFSAQAQAAPTLSQDQAALVFSTPMTVQNVQISHDGSHIVSVRGTRDRSFIAIDPLTIGKNGLPSINKAPPVTAEFGGGIVWARWLDSNWILAKVRFVERVRGKREDFYRIAAVDRKGANKRFLGRGGSGQLAARFGTDELIDLLPGQDEHVLIQSTRSFDSSTPSAIRVNVRTGERNTVQPSRSNVSHWLTDPAGVPRLGLGFGNKEKYLFYKDQSGQSFRRITIKQEEDSPFFSPITLSRTKDELYAISTHASDTLALYTYDIGTQTFKERIYSHPNYDVSGALISTTSRNVVGAAYTDDLPRRHFIDPERKALEKKVRAQFSDAVVRIDSADKDYRYAIVFTRGKYDPGAYHFVRLDNGKSAKIADAFSALPYRSLAPMKKIEYSTKDGKTIRGYLTGFNLERAENRPMVILLHGGPFYRDIQQYNPFAQFLATQGYLVLQVNYRGSSGYGWEFRKSGYRQWGLAIQRDVEEGLDWAVESGIANPNRICVAGASYGGYEALISAYKMPQKIQCSVSLNGVADLFRMLRDRRSQLDFAIDDILVGDPVKDKDRITATSPYHNAEKIGVPILLVHAADDQVVSDAHSKDMARALRRNQKPVELVIIPGADHELSFPNDRKRYFNELGDFLRKHLRGAATG